MIDFVCRAFLRQHKDLVKDYIKETGYQPFQSLLPSSLYNTREHGYPVHPEDNLRINAFKSKRKLFILSHKVISRKKISRQSSISFRPVPCACEVKWYIYFQKSPKI